MIRKRPKLRLRKQVLISIPILVFVTLITLTIILGNNKSFASEVSTGNQMTSATVTSEENNNTNGLKLSEIEYITNFSDLLEKRQKDNTIIYYAKSFKLNINRTLEIAHTLTKNYTDKNYLKTNVIASPQLAAKIGKFNSFEAGVVYFVRDLYRYPEKYGETIENMRTDETPTLKTVSKDGKIYMDNGLTFEQYFGKICDLYGVDKSIALAITHEETGILTSGLFKLSNNIGGHRGYDGWMVFTTLESGVISHVLTIKTLIDTYNIDMSDPNAVYTLSAIYVNGNPGAGISESWAGKVLYFKEKIDQKDLFTIK